MPDRLDLAARPIDGGYYLVRRHARPESFVPLPGVEDDGFRHCFTYWDSERTIRRELEEMIRSARRKVFAASFLIGDTALHDALVAAADRLMGGVYVVTQLDEKRLERSLAELELQQEPGADLRTLKNRFDQMTRHGIYVRGHRNLHAKFVVVDDEVALVSSANLMSSALDRTGENGVVITRHEEVDRLARLFARLWHTGCTHEAPPGEAYSLRPRTAAPWTAAVPAPGIGPFARVIWTDGEEHHILDSIRDIIDQAADDLLLASFSLKDLRRRPEVLFDQIASTAARGVRVRLLVRPRALRDDHMADVQALAEAGVEIHADRETHAKGVVADGRHGALFSANFDTKDGLTSGVEVGCRLDGSAALVEAHHYFTHAFDQAQLVYRLRPTHRELDQALDMPWRASWPLDRSTVVKAEASERQRFEQAASAGPVLFAAPSPEGLEMLAGRHRWRLESGGPGEPHRLAPVAATADGPTSAAVLAGWMQPESGREPRGFAATTIEWIS